jgi:hypothetical protein
MPPRSVWALVVVLTMAGCSAVPSATPHATQQRRAAANDCPEELAALPVGVTFVNRLHQVVVLSIGSGATLCGVKSSSVPAGESRVLTLDVLPGDARQLPIAVSVDGQTVTTVPYGVQVSGGSARQLVTDPNTGQLGCSRVNTWTFAIDAAAAQARLTCAGDLLVSFEYRI